MLLSNSKRRALLWHNGRHGIRTLVTHACAQYSKAFQLHHKRGAGASSIDAAARLYRELLERYPGAAEAPDAAQQLADIRRQRGCGSERARHPI